MDADSVGQIGWTAFLRGLVPQLRIEGSIGEPALRAAEDRLGHPIPLSLRSLLAETGGFSTDEFGPRDLWPLDELVTTNEALRAPTGMWAEQGPWASRLCFGDDVEGSYFYIAVNSGEVLVWNFIDGKGYPLASDLEAFYRRWLSGELTT